MRSAAHGIGAPVEWMPHDTAPGVYVKALTHGWTSGTMSVSDVGTRCCTLDALPCPRCLCTLMNRITVACEILFDCVHALRFAVIKP